VAPSNVFRRQGTTLYLDSKISMTTALLGGKVRIPTLDGDVDLRVPTGTQPGQEAILKGRGVPNVYNKSVGDLIVSFGVQLPR
jgi:molecular chaperone DnaJ